MAHINDQLCFALFAEWEIERTLSRFPPDDNEKFSTELFPDNPHSPRIHVPLEMLRGFRETNGSFALGSFFSATYELLAGYYKPVLRLLDRLRATPLLRHEADNPEDRFNGTLTESGVQPPPAEVINSAKYMRLRRNHFVHLGEDVRSDFEALLKTEGDALNSYWRNDRDSMNFRDPTFLDVFIEGETIELLKICRLILERMDDAVVTAIEIPSLIDYEAANVNKEQPSKRAQTLVTRVEHLYGLQIDQATVAARLDAAL